MTSKKNDTVIISIKPVEKRTAKIRIVGDSSLIVHAWSEKARKEMLQAQQGVKKVKVEGRRAKNPYGDGFASERIIDAICAWKGV